MFKKSKKQVVCNLGGGYYMDFYEKNLRLGSFLLIDYKNVPSMSGKFGLWNVEILSRFRGRGYGKKMIKEIIHFICSAFPEARILFLLVLIENNVAVSLYEKIGFRINEEETNKRFRKYYMEIRL